MHVILSVSKLLNLNGFITLYLMKCTYKRTL